MQSWGQIWSLAEFSLPFKISLSLFLLLFIFVGAGGERLCMPQRLCVGQRTTCENQFSHSTRWVLGNIPGSLQHLHQLLSNPDSPSPMHLASHAQGRFTVKLNAELSHQKICIYFIQWDAPWCFIWIKQLCCVKLWHVKDQDRGARWDNSWGWVSPFHCEARYWLCILLGCCFSSTSE